VTFTQVDDAWPDSPDVLAVSRSARLLEVEGKCYCNRHLTDGRITRGQWLRATDTETFDEDLTELIDARLVDVIGPGLYQLDWQHQQTREQVENGRARRRADNERRAKSLELHKAGDHTLCTHEGGGRARQTGETSSTASNGPSTGKSTKASTGPSKRAKNGRSNGASSGPSVVGSPNPPQPSPTQPVVERRVGGDGLAPDGSAGATPSGAGALPGAAGTPLDPADRLARIEALKAQWREEDAGTAGGADPAESLDGLLPAGGAGR
jgi:hypothetical protein